MTPVERIIAAYRAHEHDLRFGQYLWAAVGGNPFNVEDEALAKACEEYVPFEDTLVERL